MSRGFYQTLLFLFWMTTVLVLAAGILLLISEYNAKPNLSDVQIKAEKGGVTASATNCTPGLAVTGGGLFCLVLMIIRTPMRVDEPPNPPSDGGGGGGGGYLPGKKNIGDGGNKNLVDVLGGFDDIAAGAAAAAAAIPSAEPTTFISEVKAPLLVALAAKAVLAIRGS